MENFTFWSPTYFVFGKDQENNTAQYVKRFGGSKVLIHYGGGSVVRSGLLDRVKKSLDSEGIAYDVAYNLRMNGCIVEFYTGEGNIDDAVSYTKDNGLGCILRVFSDGKLMINDFAKNEIIETTASDFLGYYDDEEDEDECDCGCGGHHHHHDHDMH